MHTNKPDVPGQKAVRVWCSPALTVQGIIILLVGTVFSFLIAAWEIPNGDIAIACLFAVLWVGLIAALWCLRRDVFASLLLNQDGISFPAPAKKREFVPYPQYSHVYLGRYAHGFVGFSVTFIVLSRRFIPAAQLDRVNELSQSPDIAKIRFSQRNYNLLHALLPIRQRLVLEKACEGLISEKT